MPTIKSIGFGELFHTYFRKGSDTPFSVLMWNLVHVVHEREYASLVTHVDIVLGDRESLRPGELREVMLHWVPCPEFGNTHGNCLQGAIKCMPDEEWDGLEYWLRECGISIQNADDSKEQA